MTILAHLTDLHFGAEDPIVAAALPRELNDEPPDLVVISGDLTQRARPREFQAARAFLDSLGAPWLAVPGNHDIPPFNLLERFTDPYRRWRHVIAAETAPRWHNGDIAVFGLNSVRRLGPHWDWSRGHVTRGRLAVLITDLDAAPPGLARVVVVHHPLLALGNQPRHPVAGGAGRALRAMARHGVTLVLSGHLHRGSVQTTHWPPTVVHGATATSFRLRGEPNAYNRINIDPDGDVRITTRVWDGHGWRDGARMVAPAMNGRV